MADLLQPFRDWQLACARLRAAESRGDEYSDIVRLSAELIRTRNVLTFDQVRAGWHAPADILRHMASDELLLVQGDDRAQS